MAGEGEEGRRTKRVWCLKDKRKSAGRKGQSTVSSAAGRSGQIRTPSWWSSVTLMWAVEGECQGEAW